MGAIAYTFHFPPSELWEMDHEELHFWYDRAVELVQHGK